MVRKNKLKKELVVEDWCFVCKDGGSLRICDYKDCPKAYHPECVEKDDSLLESDERWTCNWHCCCFCNKAPKCYCFCCPSAVCRCCLDDAGFALITKKKGFCESCLELVWLIEEKKDVDSNGNKVDFHDRDTVEFMFYEYWEIIKGAEGLTSEQIISAYNQLNKGSDLCEQDEGKGGTSESDDESELDKSDDDTDGYKLNGRRKRTKGQLSAMKKKLKSKKQEFTSWGSEPLLEFLASIGKDTSTQMSQFTVMDIIAQYCKENKLFDPEKRKRIKFDARLQALLRRKIVNRNNLYNLLTPHLAENLAFSEDELEFGSENFDEDDLLPWKKQKRLNSTGKSSTKVEVVNVQKSCFASIVPKNIKLLYLRKSFVEELSNQLETFEAKVTGTFVRIRSDPNDYLQKNSHMLVQVTGVKKTSNVNSKIMLQVSNMVKEVPIHKLSDDDFSEEECADLCERVKTGLLKRLTVEELEKRARSLHEEITKHWISRELVLLQNRIDRANEKGWRRELFEYLDSLQLLKKPEEQSRLLREIPEVIADDFDLEPIPEDATVKGEQEQNDGSSVSTLGRTSQTPCCDLKCNGTSCNQYDATYDAGIQAKEACNSSSSDSDKRFLVDGMEERDSVVRDSQDCKSTMQYVQIEKKELQSAVKDLNEFNFVVKGV